MTGMYFLHKVLKDRNIQILSQVPSRWFFLSEEIDYYNALKKFVSKYDSLPPAPAVEPEGYEDYPLEYWLDQLRLRYVKHLLARIKSEDVPEDSLDRYVENIRRELENLASERYRLSMVHRDELHDFAFSIVNKLRLDKVSKCLGYPTGYPSLDLATSGYVPGDVVVYAARMKMGKTMYLLNSLATTAQHVDCLFLSMEMPLEQIVRRLLALQLQDDSFFPTGKLTPSFLDKDIERVVGSLKVDFVNGASLTDISELFAIANVYKPKVLFIDGAYLLPIRDNVRSEWERAKRIIEGIRNFALRSNIAVACTWQLNRLAVKKAKNGEELGGEHIAFTDAVAQAAAAVVFIVGEDNEKRFVLRYVRDGRPAEFGVNWNWKDMKFDEKGEVVLSKEEEDVIEEIMATIEEGYGCVEA